MINIKDANGHWVALEDDAIMQLITADATIYGLTMNEIVYLKNMYQSMNGIFPVTEQRIQEILDDE